MGARDTVTSKQLYEASAYLCVLVKLQRFGCCRVDILTRVHSILGLCGQNHNYYHLTQFAANLMKRTYWTMAAVRVQFGEISGFAHACGAILL